jgi:hypothetical protein
MGVFLQNILANSFLAKWIDLAGVNDCIWSWCYWIDLGVNGSVVVFMKSCIDPFFNNKNPHVHLLESQQPILKDHFEVTT